LTELPSVMIVDDLPANLRLMSRMLRREKYRVRPFPSGRLALASARQDPPDLIVLDISMPEMDGYQVCQHLKSSDQLRDIPVIFLSALDDTVDKVRAFQAGGVDYVTKPFQLEEIRARISTHLTRRQLERELQIRNQQLQDSFSRLQDLEKLRDGLVHMLAHDMRNPLTSILSNCHYLNETLTTHPIEQSAKVLSDIQLGAIRLSEMIAELLDINRLESGELPLHLSTVEPRALIEQCRAEMHQREATERVHIEGDASRPISCDVRLMKRVVCNLLDNAWKYAPDQTPIQVQLSETPHSLFVAVIDQGAGVPEDLRERIFEKFFCLDQEKTRHSIGLGLAFCKLAVEAHGGSIGIDRVPTSGESRFYFSLPTVSARSEK
jgi:two-component system sensor histidine kinase/response regulator